MKERATCSTSDRDEPSWVSDAVSWSCFVISPFCGSLLSLININHHSTRLPAPQTLVKIATGNYPCIAPMASYPHICILALKMDSILPLLRGLHFNGPELTYGTWLPSLPWSQQCSTSASWILSLPQLLRTAFASVLKAADAEECSAFNGSLSCAHPSV